MGASCPRRSACENPSRRERRDAHLRSADFLEVEAYPEITFRSTEFVHEGAGDWRLIGRPFRPAGRSYSAYGRGILWVQV
jgi:hypothetical protein